MYSIRVLPDQKFLKGKGNMYFRTRPLILWLALGLHGCAFWGPRMVVNGRPSDENAVKILQLFDLLKTAVNDDDMDGVLALMSPTLSAEALHEQKMLLEEALYSARYTGYQPYAQEGLAKVAESHGIRGWVRVHVPYVNADERWGKDLFELERVRGRWWFRWIGLRPPRKGDVMDMAAAERRQIMDIVAKCVKAFEQQDIGTLRYAYSTRLPYPQYREEQAWMSQFLDIMKYEFYSSSFMPDKTPITYFAPQKVEVVVHFRYKLPDVEDLKERSLQANFRFAKGPEGWGLLDISIR